MVVVSNNWTKNASSYPNNSDVIVTPSKMAARAVLICWANSHPFQERSLTLDQPVKIGRSVARARAAPNNAIFDCKVLSRNHALLWFENGKFYLQDTKSSNGTFVNNQRLSKGAEESLPREIYSGDIVQFGVDVMENARQDNMATGTMSAETDLASSGDSAVAAMVTHGCIVAALKLYLPDGKEAKASSSSSVGNSAGDVPMEDLYQLNQYLQEALHREALLENKLSAIQRLLDSTRQATGESWRALIDEDRLLSRVEILENQLQAYSKNYPEDKLRDEIKKLQEDKQQYLTSAKESLKKILQEKMDAIVNLTEVKRTLSETEEEVAHLKQLRERGQQELQELATKYSQQLQKSEDFALKLQEVEEQYREVFERMEQEKQELLDSELALKARLMAVSKDGELSQKQLSALQARLSTMKDESLETKSEMNATKEADNPGQQVDIILEKITPQTGVEENRKELVETLRCKLQKSEDELQEWHSEVDRLYMRMEECRLQQDMLLENVQQLGDQLASHKQELERLTSENSQGPLAPPNQVLKLRQDIFKLEEALWKSQLWVDQYECLVVVLKDLLTESRAKARSAEEQVLHYKQEMENAQNNVKRITEEQNHLEQELHDHVKSIMYESDELKKNVLRLQNELANEKELSKSLFEQSEQLRKDLIEAQQSTKQAFNEAEQLKDRFITLQAEVEASEQTSRKILKDGSCTYKDRPLTSIEDQQRLKDYDQLSQTFQLLRDLNQERPDSSLLNFEKEKVQLAWRGIRSIYKGMEDLSVLNGLDDVVERLKLHWNIREIFHELDLVDSEYSKDLSLFPSEFEIEHAQEVNPSVETIKLEEDRDQKISELEEELVILKEKCAKQNEELLHKDKEIRGLMKVAKMDTGNSLAAKLNDSTIFIVFISWIVVVIIMGYMQFF